MSSLSRENCSQYWQEYKMETGAGSVVIVFICHISMQPHLYCGGWQCLDARCIVYPTEPSKFSKEARDIRRCLRFPFYKWDLSVETAESHSHHAERDVAPCDIIKVSPKHLRNVCIPVTEAIIHKHKQMFFMWSRVNLLTSAVVCNTVRVNRRLQRWRSDPFVILWFVFLSWHPVLRTLPAVMRNVLSAPSRRGACHSMEGCHKNMLKPAQRTCPRMMIYSHKRKLLT